jgi:hypothetical protein
MVYLIAGLFNHAGNIPADGQREFGGELFLCLTGNYFLIDRVDRAGINLDQYFVFRRLRYRYFVQLQHVGAAKSVNSYCFHHYLLLLYNPINSPCARIWPCIAFSSAG